MPITAWFMDVDTAADQRLPHKQEPNKPVSREELAALGVISWEGLDADNHETDPQLAKIRTERGYSYVDFITISPDKLPNYEDKLKIFFKEHLHTDEEIRYILDGTGYFDIRDKDDAWIRIAMGKGDMIVLPAGIYHRFTLDDANYLKAMRLFVGEPVWTPYNRADDGTDGMKPRGDYLTSFVAPLGGGAAAPVAAAAAGVSGGAGAAATA